MERRYYLPNESSTNQNKKTTITRTKYLIAAVGFLFASVHTSGVLAAASSLSSDSEEDRTQSYVAYKRLNYAMQEARRVPIPSTRSTAAGTPADDTGSDRSADTSLRVVPIPSSEELADQVIIPRSVQYHKPGRKYAVWTQHLLVSAFSTCEGEEGSESKILDWYHLMLRSSIAKGKNSRGKVSKKKFTDVRFYWHISNPRDPEGVEDTAIQIANFAPKTTEGKTKITSKLAFEIGADITAIPPTVKTSPKITMERTKEREVADLTMSPILNGQKMGWLVSVNNKDCDSAVTGPTCDMEWVWCVNRQEAMEKGIYTKIDKHDDQMGFILKGTCDFEWKRVFEHDGRISMQKAFVPMPSEVLYSSSARVNVTDESEATGGQ